MPYSEFFVHVLKFGVDPSEPKLGWYAESSCFSRLLIESGYGSIWIIDVVSDPSEPKLDGFLIESEIFVGADT